MWIEVDLHEFQLSEIIKEGSYITITRPNTDGSIRVHTVRVESILDDRNIAPFPIGKSQPKLFISQEMRWLVRNLSNVSGVVDKLNKVFNDNIWPTSYGAINIEPDGKEHDDH